MPIVYLDPRFARRGCSAPGLAAQPRRGREVDPARIRTFARERGWRQLRLLSSRNNDYNRDYHAEAPDGEQIPILNVFTRDGDGLRHRWATELMFAPRDDGEEPRHVDLIWPIWNVLDMTPGGRGSESNFPAMQYE